jgi:hypothetical protein
MDSAAFTTAKCTRTSHGPKTVNKNLQYVVVGMDEGNKG